MLVKLYNVFASHYKEITRKSNDVLTYLGITVTKIDDNSITITQPTLVKKIIDAANLNKCNGISTTMSTTQTYHGKFNDIS